MRPHAYVIGGSCSAPGHRHFADPATEKRRCIECEEAWLDRIAIRDGRSAAVRVRRMREGRNHAIAQARAQGATHRELAANFGITKRSVIRILAATRQEQEVA